MATPIRRKVAQQIVESVKDVCGHDINFIDQNGIIFASTDAVRVGNYHEVGKQVIQQGRIIEAEHDNEYFGTHQGVNIPFFHHGEVVAVIGISGKPDEVRKYAYLAKRITALILREHELDMQHHTEEAERNYLIRCLITGEQINQAFLKEQLAPMNLEIGTICRTVVVKLLPGQRPSDHPMLEHEIKQTFRHTGSSLFTFSYPNEYILILPQERWSQSTSGLQAFSRSHSDLLKVGVGNCSALIHQSRSYQSAVLALNSLGYRESYADFDDLDLEILLGSMNDSAKRHFLSKTIHVLDEKQRALLRAYFQNDTSLKQTCEHLYLHKNTLQYQLDKIGQTCGYNPRRFQDAVVLFLALKLEDKQENEIKKDRETDTE